MYTHVIMIESHKQLSWGKSLIAIGTEIRNENHLKVTDYFGLVVHFKYLVNHESMLIRMINVTTIITKIRAHENY